MLSTMKLFSAFFAIVLVLANCQSLRADLVTYELGPFYVVGEGETESEAYADALGELYDMLIDIENNLPEGHVLLDFEIENQGWISELVYEIDFHVIVWIPDDPGPPGGGL